MRLSVGEFKEIVGYFWEIGNNFKNKEIRELKTENEELKKELKRLIEEKTT